MVELNTEYTYKAICDTLKWSYQPSNNNTKERQIRCIEESYEFFHPINPKTKKEKKSYIFTHQIKEPILEDGRKNNGGARTNSGRKFLIPDEEFDLLWRNVVSAAYRLNHYYEREWLNKVYFSNTLLFSEYGFSYSKYLNKANFDENDNIVRYVFSNIVYDALKANTITRLCKRYNFPKNSLPKGILRAQSSKKLTELISDDKLLPTYNEIEKQGFAELHCNDIKDVVKQGKYNDLMEYIDDKMLEHRKYHVRKYNMIQVNDFDVKENYERFSQHDPERSHRLEQYQQHFRDAIFSSVEKSCLKRIEDTEGKYKLKLTANQKILLKKYLYNILDKKDPNADSKQYDSDAYAWLDLLDL